MAGLPIHFFVCFCGCLWRISLGLERGAGLVGDTFIRPYGRPEAFGTSDVGDLNTAIVILSS